MRNLLNERWILSGFDRDKAVELCKNDINPLVSVLLASRGITEPEEAKAFLDADAMPLSDPFLMADMDKAVGRINKAVEGKETIAIYGDYDVDGMTSAALLALWLRSKGIEPEIYIPNRFSEGFSLNTQALDTLKARGIALVITVDCGIIAVNEALHAKNIGLDLIITDHHESNGSIPDAIAVVDPKRSDCAYPFKYLAGVGVVFKLICALESNSLSNKDFDRYGQLVTLGTIADVMPVIGENRKLIIHGLKAMNKKPLPGLQRLLEEACPDCSRITATDISYFLAPRLNAAGRMGDPMSSVKLLLSEDTAQAKQYVIELCELNTKRRELEQKIYEEALEELGSDEGCMPIILANEKWNQGVTGIIAAKLTDRYRLPTIIISIRENGIGRGSCRTAGSFPIYDALCTCEDILIEFGGHKKAAGFDIAAENIEELRRRITEYYQDYIEVSPQTGLCLDFEVDKPELLSLRNMEALACLEPFGNANKPPYLCMTNTALTSMQAIGAEGQHTKLKVSKAGQLFECIIFSVPPGELGVAVGDTVDIAFEPQINEYRNRRNVQLQLLDIRKSRDS